jgi:4-hydroxy-tetrahydrodipicolinate synthase
MTVSFHGIFTPLITPIQEDESLDLDSLDRLVRFQLQNGVHGLWAMGTSSEFASFEEGERAAAIATVVRAAGGRVPVIANASDASTRLTIRHARRAAEAGADAIAATPPYYYSHSQDELLAHYRRIRAAIDLPLFIYNIPQTVRVRAELSTAKALAAEGTVAGIKDSQNDLEWFRQLTLFSRRRGLPFTAFAGTRQLIDAGVLAGAVGAIPSIANAFPDLCVACYDAAAAGDFERSACLSDRIVEIEAATGLVSEGCRNAAILGLQKTILHRRGIIDTPALTSPLRTPTPDEQEALWFRVSEVLTPAR